MAIVFNEELTEAFDYVIREQEGENPFTVSITPIPSDVFLKLEDGVVSETPSGEVIISSGAYNVMLCYAGITGWANLLDKDGEQVEMTMSEGGFIDHTSLQKLPANVLTEIAGVIGAVSNDLEQVKLFAKA